MHRLLALLQAMILLFCLLTAGNIIHCESETYVDVLDVDARTRRTGSVRTNERGNSCMRGES